jgi:apyrase
MVMPLSRVALLTSLALNLILFVTLERKLLSATTSEIAEEDVPAGCVPRFAVVFDAGSTGSRIHVYEFLYTGIGHIQLKDELFEKVSPGLSAYAEDPVQGARSLIPLLESAKKKIPKRLQQASMVHLGATAGLRMLPGNKSEALLGAVRDLLPNYRFSFNKHHIYIMSGMREGEYAWVALNYLIGKLGRPPSSTVGVIDLGGGSVQMMRALQETSSSASFPEGYTVSSEGGAQWGGGYYYDLYVHSFLGWGLMAGRMAVLEFKPEAQKICILPGVVGKYSYKVSLLYEEVKRIVTRKVTRIVTAVHV